MVDKAVQDNINQIRNLKLEIDAQKVKIKNVIQQYKLFNEEEQEKSRSKDENMLNQSNEGNKLKELTKLNGAKKNINVENHPKTKSKVSEMKCCKKSFTEIEMTD